MALSTEDRKSSTRREDAPAFYRAYMNSPTWRRTRNEALARANWTCHHCGSKRDLNVHHKTYVRLGAELSTDLEVLCFGCHNEHHRAEAETNPLGIYLKITSEVLRTQAFDSVADISDTVKTLCATRKIAVDSNLIAKAISLACATRLKEHGQMYRSVADVPHDSPEHHEPLTHGQTVELLARLFGSVKGPTDAIKRMPRVTMRTQGDIDRERALEMVAAEIKASLERCAELESADV
jgi:hypothetical protein